MDYEFNNEYLAKMFISLIQEEGSRIMSLGLAKKENVSKFVESSLSAALKDNNDTNIILNALSSLHAKLSSVKLPGDFEKTACVSGFKDLIDAINNPDGPEIIEIKITEEVPPQEEKHEEHCLTYDELEKSEEDDEEVKKTIAELEQISYRLGKQGKHIAAYTIDRTINELEDFIKK